MALKVKESAAPFVPKERTLKVLAEAVQKCSPSAILRAQTDEDRHAQMRTLVEDLREAARVARL